MSMTLRLTDEQDAVLTTLAKLQGVSKNEAVLRAIIDRYQRMKDEQELGDALADTLSRYPRTIQRLGE